MPVTCKPVWEIIKKVSKFSKKASTYPCYTQTFVVQFFGISEVEELSELYLILENGTVFEGKQFGHDGEALGELVFSTAMTGYLETLSDPAYYGQIVLQTFPLIGNYGVIREDFGPGKAHLKAYIVRDWCQEPSNFRSEGNLDSFLSEKKIPGLYGIDTRRLTREIRQHGTMNAMISKKPQLCEEEWLALKNYKITDAVAGAAEDNCSEDTDSCCNNKTSGKEKAQYKYNVALWDFGGAYRLVEFLSKNGYRTCVCKYNSSVEMLLDCEPDGVILTGGPGDPNENTQIIEEIKKLCAKNIPILAVGLGHQMLATANGAKTEKLLFGHRGANQAVKEVRSERAFVTAQNHGYIVSSESLPENMAMSFVNVNDGTCEGLEYTNMPALSIQFDPTEEIIEHFGKMMEGGNSNASK